MAKTKDVIEGMMNEMPFGLMKEALRLKTKFKNGNMFVLKKCMKCLSGDIRIDPVKKRWECSVCDGSGSWVDFVKNELPAKKKDAMLFVIERIFESSQKLKNS